MGVLIRILFAYKRFGLTRENELFQSPTPEIAPLELYFLFLRTYTSDWIFKVLGNVDVYVPFDKHAKIVPEKPTETVSVVKVSNFRQLHH